MEEQGEETLAVYQLPPEHPRRVQSSNLLERLNQEIKRRTRVIRVFPNEAACLRLISALAMETNLEWMERVYLKRTRQPSARRRWSNSPRKCEFTELSELDLRTSGEVKGGPTSESGSVRMLLSI